MDRFIGVSEVFKKIYNGDLKSNMDRFIVAFTNPRTKMITDLKSNMDRFIDTELPDIHNCSFI